MKIRTITMVNFTCHEKTDVDLPDCGIVLVTGPNGSGKSSLAEAVAACMWNHTLRGTSPWRTGASGLVTVETDRIVASRKRSAKGVGSLKWWPPGGEAGEFQSTRAKQEALEAEVGTWEVWRRTCVFSSQDAAHFTLAPDADRKRLIESLIGVGRFDAALRLCREDMKLMQAQATRAEHDLQLAQAKLSGVVQRKADAEAALALAETVTEPADAPPPDTAALQAEADELQTMFTEARGELGAARAAVARHARAVAEAEAAVKQAAKRAEFFMRDKCPTCEQDLPADKRAEALQAVQDAKSAAESERTIADANRAEDEATVQELEDELESLREQRSGVQASIASVQSEAKRIAAEHAEWERTHAQAARARMTLDEVASEVRGLEAAVAEAETGRKAARTDAEVLAAVEKVLGVRGVRAQVTGKALGGIEAVANKWLAQIAGPGMSLTLRSYTEKKTGGVNDAISLDVTGAGGGYGYKASSGGERRRIDVAILLALAEVASAAHGNAGGTLWFDEVFDALDTDGVEAVAGALDELARDRCVVVISHNQTLARRLTTALRLEAEAGKLTKRYA